MGIQITPLKEHFPLELESIRLYGTGPNGKVYTDHFYRMLNHNFGIEIRIRNNTMQSQKMRLTCCIYPVGSDSDKTLYKWNKVVDIREKSTSSIDFYVTATSFSRIPIGKFKVQFWINNQKVKKTFFTVTQC